MLVWFATSRAGLRSKLFDNNGVAMIRLYAHGSVYTVRCRVEQVI